MEYLHKMTSFIIVITIETCSADAEERLDLQSERRHRHLRCRHFVASEEAEVDQKERDADQKNQMPTKRIRRRQKDVDVLMSSMSASFCYSSVGILSSVSASFCRHRNLFASIKPSCQHCHSLNRWTKLDQKQFQRSKIGFCHKISSINWKSMNLWPSLFVTK